MSQPTYSDFQRLQGQVEDTIDRKVERIEDKLDGVAAGIARLMLLEERQARQADRATELANQIAAERTRMNAAEISLQALKLELHGHLQRYLGAAAVVSIVAGGGFAFFLRLMH